MPSFVGYPKDVVSRKLLKKDVLYGDEAIEKRLSLDCYRPLEHGVLKGSSDGAGDQPNMRAAHLLAYWSVPSAPRSVMASGACSISFSKRCSSVIMRSSLGKNDLSFVV